MATKTVDVDDALPVERARTRLSAFLYGNILVLAALIQSQPDTVEDGGAATLVAVTMLTTYLAHVVADLVGQGLGRETADRRAHVRVELRDAVPILSSGGPPVALLVAGALGWLGWLDPSWVLLVAVLFVIARLASIGWLAGRYRAGSSRRRTFWTGVALAGIGLAVAVLEVVLTH